VYFCEEDIVFFPGREYNVHLSEEDSVFFLEEDIMYISVKRI